MSFAYKEEENEKKENEINVNENFQFVQPKKRYGLQGMGDIMKRIDTLKRKQAKPKKDKPDDIIKRDFLADEIAKALGDQQSVGAFRKIAELVPERIIRDYLAAVKETWQEGKIKKSRGALFISMIQEYSSNHHIVLGFQQRTGNTLSDAATPPLHALQQTNVPETGTSPYPFSNRILMRQTGKSP